MGSCSARATRTVLSRTTLGQERDLPGRSRKSPLARALGRLGWLPWHPCPVHDFGSAIDRVNPRFVFGSEPLDLGDS